MGGRRCRCSVCFCEKNGICLSDEGIGVILAGDGQNDPVRSQLVRSPSFAEQIDFMFVIYFSF